MAKTFKITPASAILLLKHNKRPIDPRKVKRCVEQMEKEMFVDIGKGMLPHISEKYLQECRARALSADPTKNDPVIKDLRKRIIRLTKHITKLQNP